MSDRYQHLERVTKKPRYQKEEDEAYITQGSSGYGLVEERARFESIDVEIVRVQTTVQLHRKQLPQLHLVQSIRGNLERRRHLLLVQLKQVASLAPYVGKATTRRTTVQTERVEDAVVRAIVHASAVQVQQLSVRMRRRNSTPTSDF